MFRLNALKTDRVYLRYAWSAAGYLLISIPVFFGDILPPSVIGASTGIKHKEQTIDADSSKVAVRTESN